MKYSEYFWTPLSGIFVWDIQAVKWFICVVCWILSFLCPWHWQLARPCAQLFQLIIRLLSVGGSVFWNVSVLSRSFAFTLSVSPQNCSCLSELFVRVRADYVWFYFSEILFCLCWGKCVASSRVAVFFLMVQKLFQGICTCSIHV